MHRISIDRAKALTINYNYYKKVLIMFIISALNKYPCFLPILGVTVFIL